MPPATGTGHLLSCLGKGGYRPAGRAGEALAGTLKGKAGPLTLANSTAPVTGQRIRYVCMPGSPFTGSTLLGVLLNEHPDCASMGESTGLIWRVDLATYECSCGKLYRECEFWSRIATRTRELGHPVNVYQTNLWNTHLRLSRHRLINVLLVRSLGQDALNDVRDAVVSKIPTIKRATSAIAWNTWSLASAVLDVTGKKVFVDTARDHQRPKYLARHPRLDVRVIHLIRDPRGNIASIMKHTGVDVGAAARQWCRYNVEAARAQRYLPASSWMTLHYEELCADPGGVLDRVFDFLEVERVRPQPSPHDPDRHIVGNSMRLRALSEIREDLSWQTTLTGEQLEVIARIAGPVSRRMGYSWP
jgi:hypothetical protein